MDPVEVCNRALGWLSVGRVAAIDGTDKSRAGQALFEQYESIRDQVTEVRDWTFATKRFVLNQKGAAPAWGFSTSFPFETTVLRLVEVVPAPGAAAGVDAFALSMALEEGLHTGELHWAREGRQILVVEAVDAVAVKAVCQCEDPAEWTAGFADAVAARVAAELCITLTADKSLAEAQWSRYKDKLREAAANDGRGAGRSQTRSRRRVPTGRW